MKRPSTEENECYVTMPPVPRQKLQEVTSPCLPEMTTTHLCFPTTNYSKSFNEEFQNLLDKLDQHPKYYGKLSRLAQTFVRDAKMIGSLVVMEKDQNETIIPSFTGGSAGGKKFRAHGIMFKYCKDVMITDSMWVYGGSTGPEDEFAIKSGSNELKGINCFFACNVKLLRVPLVAIVNYSGFRMSAISHLPIDQATLRYGSDDGGRTVTSSPRVHNLMKLVGEQLHIKEHIVQDHSIIGPADIEVHEGKDGRFYVIDFARLMPPEDPKREQAHMYNLLRPELIKKISDEKNFLVSDAFTNFMHPDERAQAIQNIVKATKERDNEIYKLSEDLIKSNSLCASVTSSASELCLNLHARGINLRCLGDLRHYIELKRGGEVGPSSYFSPTNSTSTTPISITTTTTTTTTITTTTTTTTTNTTATTTTDFKARLARSVSVLILQEMIARVLKNYTNKNLRKLGKDNFIPEKSKKEIITVLNYITCSSKHDHFWRVDIKNLIVRKFGDNSLLEDEKSSNCLLYSNFSLFYLFQRLVELCEWPLNPMVTKTYKFLNSSDKNYRLYTRYLGELQPTVKYMGFIDYVMGKREIMKVKSIHRSNKPKLLYAISKFQDAINKCHDDEKVRVELAKANVELLKLKWDPQILSKSILQNWVKAGSRYFTTEGKLCYVECSLLVTTSRKLEHFPHIQGVLLSIPEETVENWFIRNIKQQWGFSKTSFPFFRNLFQEFIKLSFRLLSHRIMWEVLSYCLVKIKKKYFIDGPKTEREIGDLVKHETNLDLDQIEKKDQKVLYDFFDSVVHFSKQFLCANGLPSATTTSSSRIGSVGAPDDSDDDSERDNESYASASSSEGDSDSDGGGSGSSIIRNSESGTTGIINSPRHVTNGPRAGLFNSVGTIKSETPGRGGRGGGCGVLVYVWYWKERDKYWCLYDERSCTRIEKAYTNKMGEITIEDMKSVHAPKGYTIYFATTKQVNNYNNSSRMVKRGMFMQDGRYVHWLGTMCRIRQLLERRGWSKNNDNNGNNGNNGNSNGNNGNGNDNGNGNSNNNDNNIQWDKLKEKVSECLKMFNL